ncbi:hypothetical protein [Ferruginibacter sp.]
MKKKHPLLYAILLGLLLSVACNLGSGTRVVSVNNGNETLKIEYKGELFFNTAGTAIDEISPGGRVKYRRNDKELVAEPGDSGNVVYKIYFDDKKMNNNDSAVKTFFAAALQEIAENYER